MPGLSQRLADACSIEKVAAVGGRLWFKLYVLRDRAFAKTMTQAREVSA